MSNNKIAESIGYNFGFKKNSRYLTADQIGNEMFEQWSTATALLWRSAYNYVYARQEVVAGKQNSIPSEVRDAFYRELKSTLALVGEINGHALPVAEIAELTAEQSYVMKNEDQNPELMLARSQRKNARSELNKYANMNGISKDYCDTLQEQIDALTEQIHALEGVRGNCVPSLERISSTRFRKGFELVLGSAIEKQSAKSWEELEERDRKIKEERAKRAKARKKAKAQAEAQAKAQADC